MMYQPPPICAECKPWFNFPYLKQLCHLRNSALTTKEHWHLTFFSFLQYKFLGFHFACPDILFPMLHSTLSHLWYVNVHGFGQRHQLHVIQNKENYYIVMESSNSGIRNFLKWKSVLHPQILDVSKDPDQSETYYTKTNSLISKYVCA